MPYSTHPPTPSAHADAPAFPLASAHAREHTSNYSRETRCPRPARCAAARPSFFASKKKMASVIKCRSSRHSVRSLHKLCVTRNDRCIYGRLNKRRRSNMPTGCAPCNLATIPCTTHPAPATGLMQAHGIFVGDATWRVESGPSSCDDATRRGTIPSVRLVPHNSTKDPSRDPSLPSLHV